MFVTFAYLGLKLLPGAERRLDVGFKAQRLFAHVVEGNLHLLGVRLEFRGSRQALYERQQLLPFTATHLAKTFMGCPLLMARIRNKEPVHCGNSRDILQERVCSTRCFCNDRSGCDSRHCPFALVFGVEMHAIDVQTA